mgnify:CR=1 FL=1
MHTETVPNGTHLRFLSGGAQGILGESTCYIVPNDGQCRAVHSSMGRIQKAVRAAAEDVLLLGINRR